MFFYIKTTLFETPSNTNWGKDLSEHKMRFKNSLTLEQLDDSPYNVISNTRLIRDAEAVMEQQNAYYNMIYILILCINQ